MTRQEIDKEIKFLFNEAQITHSERLHLLGDLAEGIYKRPEAPTPQPLPVNEGSR